jgi:hypothetical protein
MELIRKPPLLALCKRCGRHGHIVFGDKSKSKEFSSEEEASKEVAAALLDHKILPEDAEFLRNDIRKSPLLTERARHIIGRIIRAIGGHAASLPPPCSPCPGRSIH